MTIVVRHPFSCWKIERGQPKYRDSDKLSNPSFIFSIETMMQEEEILNNLLDSKYCKTLNERCF